METLQELKRMAEDAFEQIEDYKEFKKKYGVVKNELDVILDKIKSLEKKEKKQGSRWKPEQGEIYWYVSASGSGGVLDYPWENNPFNKKAYSIGNCFPTKEAAEFEVERLKVLAEMKEFSFEPNWEDTDEVKYYILISFDEILIDTIYAKNIGTIVFESKEQAQACIETIGEERLKKYYFRVK